MVSEATAPEALASRQGDERLGSEAMLVVIAFILCANIAFQIKGRIPVFDGVLVRDAAYFGSQVLVVGKRWWLVIDRRSLARERFRGSRNGDDCFESEVEIGLLRLSLGCLWEVVIDT